MHMTVTTQGYWENISIIQLSYHYAAQHYSAVGEHISQIYASQG